MVLSPLAPPPSLRTASFSVSATSRPPALATYRIGASAWPRFSANKRDLENVRPADAACHSARGGLAPSIVAASQTIASPMRQTHLRGGPHMAHLASARADSTYEEGSAEN